MGREEVERAIEKAGWKLDAGFLGELVVGHDSVVSLLAYPSAWEDDDPSFEISHELEDRTYWVRGVPTPQRAIELIEKHGGPPEEERGNLGTPSEADGEERSS